MSASSSDWSESNGTYSNSSPGNSNPTVNIRFLGTLKDEQFHLAVLTVPTLRQTTIKAVRSQLCARQECDDRAHRVRVRDSICSIISRSRLTFSATSLTVFL